MTSSIPARGPVPSDARRDTIRGFVLPTPTRFRPESLVGTTLDGRYRLVEHLASGGMGSIFRSEHVYMRKDLALKVLRPDLSALPDIAERFRREAEIAASLEHENIVRVTDFGRSPEGWLFLAMELLEGESLFERLRRSGPMMPEEASRVLVQVCRGLDAAHARGVVHRDLKPENVFLTARPPGLVKILDFGIAKITDPRIVSDTQAGMVVGTPEYLSPEQASGGAVDGRADIYAVGLIAWRMLAGHHPFKAEDGRGLLLMQATKQVPPITEARSDLAAWPELVEVIARACAKSVGDRYQSAADLAEALESCLGPLDALPAEAGADSRTRSRPWATPPRQLAATPYAPGMAPLQATVTLEAAAATGAGAAGSSRRWTWALAACALLAIAVPAGFAVARWLEARPAQRARELLSADEPEAARDFLAPAVLRRPDDARLRALQGRALHRIDGQEAAGVDAYAAGFDLDAASLDGEALSDLARDLGGDRALAERAAHLLARVGAPAVPALVNVSRGGTGSARLRALDLLHELGAQGEVDVVATYLSLLEDGECEVSRAAARQLGELGSSAAIPKLTEVSRRTRQIHGLLGKPQQVPTCSSAEAEAALRKIQGR